MKKQKGITLIALVITIIVLLILAGITITMLTGQDSVPQKAVEASNANKIGEAKESASLLILGYIQDFYDQKYVQNSASGTLIGFINDKFKTGGTASFKTVDKFKMKVDDGKLTITDLTDATIATGTVKTDGTIVWDDNGGGPGALPEGVEKVSTLTKDDYGKKFDLGNDFEWKLLYNDTTNKKIYLILSDYLPISSVPSGITFNPPYNSDYLYTANKNSNDALLAEFNSTAWKGMLSTELQSNNQITVKGTVDLATLQASYNQHFTPVDYQTSNGKLSPTGTLASLYVHQKGSLPKDGNVAGYFLSTTDSYGTFRYVNDSGSNSYLGSGGRFNDSFAIRPVVILDSDILVYEDNGVMKIYNQ